MHSSSAYNTVALETFLLSNLIWVLFKSDFNTRQNKTTVYFCLGEKKMGESTVTYAVSTSDFSTKGQLKESRFI